MGHTLNMMTLGGLALAVGILVDDATVRSRTSIATWEEALREAVLDGARRSRCRPLSTLTICIVFVSVVFLTGPAKYLFTPMALAVVFAMAASYLLSRTLVPVMAAFLLRGEQHEVNRRPALNASQCTAGWFARFNDAFNDGFIAVRTRYTGCCSVSGTSQYRVRVFRRRRGDALVLLPFVGRDSSRRSTRASFGCTSARPPGLRLERQSRSSARSKTKSASDPEEEIELMLDNIGRPAESFNLAFGDGSTIGTFDGEILVALKEGDHGPTAEYIRRFAADLPNDFPDLTFFFQPADIVSQILNFGLPAPIDIQVAGHNPKQLRDRAEIGADPGVPARWTCTFTR